MSDHKPPRKARVYRSGGKRGGSRKRSRSGGGGLLKAVTGPVGLVVLGLAVVFGVGYWVNNYYKPADTKSEPAAAAPSTPAPKQNAAPAAQSPAASTTPAPTPAKPVEQPADPNKQVRDGRTHIDRAAGAAQSMVLPIYYSDGLTAGDTLQPVEVRVPQSVSQVKTAAEQLLNAPEDLKLYSGIPAGTKVLSVDYNAKTGVATVDLSAEARQVQAGDVARVRAEFVYTLSRVPGVKSVQLWILGHPAMLHEWQWSKPLTEADVQGFKVESLIKFVPKS